MGGSLDLELPAGPGRGLLARVTLQRAATRRPRSVPRVGGQDALLAAGADAKAKRPDRPATKRNRPRADTDGSDSPQD